MALSLLSGIASIVTPVLQEGAADLLQAGSSVIRGEIEKVIDKVSVYTGSSSGSAGNRPSGGNGKRNGKNVKDRLEKFQSKAGLKPDGWFGPKTLEKCVGMLGEKNLPILLRNSADIAQGRFGQQTTNSKRVVREIQHGLGVPQTGHFGAREEAAVKSLQGGAGLKRTGRVDPPTVQALIKRRAGADRPNGRPLRPTGRRRPVRRAGSRRVT